MQGIGAYLITYLFCVVGVLASILIPILYGLLPEVKLGSATYGSLSLDQLRPLVAPVLITAVLSLIISLFSALIVLAASGGDLSPYAALLAGYASDSTLQRLKDSQPETTPGVTRTPGTTRRVR